MGGADQRTVAELGGGAGPRMTPACGSGGLHSPLAKADVDTHTLLDYISEDSLAPHAN